MILVFFILGIIIFISSIVLIFLLSNLRIKIENLHILYDEDIKIDFLIIISIYFLNRIKIFNIKIDKQKILSKIDLKKIREESKKNKIILRSITRLDYKIRYFKVEGYFGTFNSVLSSNIFLVIQSILPIFLAQKLDGKYINNFKFLKEDKNTINVFLDCIIAVKIVNIINILQLSNKVKKGGIKENGGTSNRRFNAYSNE